MGSINVRAHPPEPASPYIEVPSDNGELMDRDCGAYSDLTKQTRHDISDERACNHAEAALDRLFRPRGLVGRLIGTDQHSDPVDAKYDSQDNEPSAAQDSIRHVDLCSCNASSAGCWVTDAQGQGG
jgi:hypothetical protein